MVDVTAVHSANFEPISVEDKADKIVRILYQSLRNLRKNVTQVDISQRKLQENATDMRRQSYLGELDVLYCYALKCKAYPVGDGQSYLLLMMEYIDLFYDKADVVSDLRNYVKLLSYPTDANAIRQRIQDRIRMAEQAEPEVKKQTTFSNDPSQQVHVLTPMKLLRYNYVYYKMMRLLGAYNKLDDGERLDLVNKIFTVFLQAMEYHPKASSNQGVGA